MYERSAIVLERYFNTIFGFDEKINLKSLYNSYKELIEEICKYQDIIDQEEKVIEQFDKVANEIQNIQKEQKKLYKSNIKMEEERNNLFDDLDEDPAILEKKLEKIGQAILNNNQRLEEIKNSFTEYLKEFIERQKERNKYSKARRAEEKIHIQLVDRIQKELNDTNTEKLKELKQFITSEEKDDIQNSIAAIMINNGKEEKVKFNEDVVNKSILARIQIAKKEAECYIAIYDKIKKILNEIENEDLKIEKYQKTLRDVSIKLEFLKAEKEYIVSFLDNERMTAINGTKAHKLMMTEACEKFELDIEQFENLYQLILKEISGKSSKKAYNELYNKEYLKNIEEKERNFEEAITNIKLKAGTIINSNYWRIDGIKNIYEVFQNEITTKFGKDLSEYKLEEVEVEDDSNDIESYNLYKSDDIKQEEIKNNEDITKENFEYENEDLEDNDIDEFFEYDDDEEDDEYEEYDDEDEYYDEDEYEEEYEEDDEPEYEDDYEDDDENEYEYDNFYKYNYELNDNKDKNIKEQKDRKIPKDKNSKSLFNKFFKDKNNK